MALQEWATTSVDDGRIGCGCRNRQQERDHSWLLALILAMHTRRGGLARVSAVPAQHDVGSVECGGRHHVEEAVRPVRAREAEEDVVQLVSLRIHGTG